MREESKAMGLEVVPELTSGAFHDALSMAKDCKIAMIFVQSKDGISHDPRETFEPMKILLSGLSYCIKQLSK